MAGFVSLQLVIILLLVLGKVILNLGKLLYVRLALRIEYGGHLPRQG